MVANGAKRIAAAFLVFTCLAAGLRVFSQNCPLIGQNINGWNYTCDSIVKEEILYGGRHIDVVEIWVYWNLPFSDLKEECDAVYDHGSLLELTFQPCDSTGAGYKNSQIIAGTFDAYLRRYASEIKIWGKPVWLRPMHEMNGDWFGWSPGINGNSPESYSEAWKHIVDLFREEGASNVKWVYSVNFENKGDNTFLGQYPGDNYVDFLSIDGYNWGTAEKWSQWKDFDAVFSEAYHVLQEKQKSIIISEWGCVEEGGDKAGWIRDAFAKIRFSGRYDLIFACIWFDLKAGNDDFRIDSSPSSLKAYKDAVNGINEPLKNKCP